jgi:hypothetical protein
LAPIGMGAFQIQIQLSVYLPAAWAHASHFASC